MYFLLSHSPILGDILVFAEKTWVSHSSIATFLGSVGIRSHSIFDGQNTFTTYSKAHRVTFTAYNWRAGHETRLRKRCTRNAAKSTCLTKGETPKLVKFQDSPNKLMPQPSQYLNSTKKNIIPSPPKKIEVYSNTFTYEISFCRYTVYASVRKILANHRGHSQFMNPPRLLCNENPAIQEGTPVATYSLHVCEKFM